MQGSMMQWPLLVSSLLVHAERHHGEQQVVSRRVEGDIHRTTFRELAARARQMANALARLKLQSGDRVATLAWNGYRHLELYYAVSGSGAGPAHAQPAPAPRPGRLHRRPRRGPRAVLRPHVPAAGRGDRAAREDDQDLRRDDRSRPHADGQQDPRPGLLRRDGAGRERRLRVAELRREPGLVALLHVGDDGQSERRPVQPPLDASAHLRGRPARRAQLLGEGLDPAGRADVPRQRLGPAVRRLHDGIEARLARRRSRRQVALRAVRERARDGLGRRADGVARAAHVRRVERPRVLDHATHHHRRVGVPAGDDDDVPGALQRASAPRLGHDRDEPGRHGRGAEGIAGRPAAGRALRAPEQAGARGLRRRHEDRRWRGPRDPLGRRAFGRAAGARAVDRLAVLQGRWRRPARAATPTATGGFRPATSRPSTPAAPCRSPTARRT